MTLHRLSIALGFTDLTLTRVRVAQIEHSGAMAASWFKLTTTKRRVFQSRCSRCRRLHARGRRGRVHRDKWLHGRRMGNALHPKREKLTDFHGTFEDFFEGLLEDFLEGSNDGR